MGSAWLCTPKYPRSASTGELMNNRNTQIVELSNENSDLIYSTFAITKIKERIFVSNN